MVVIIADHVMNPEMLSILFRKCWGLSYSDSIRWFKDPIQDESAGTEGNAQGIPNKADP